MLFFDRPSSGERCVLVHIQLPEPDVMEDMEEFKSLAISAKAAPVALVSGSRRKPHPRWFVGEGKLDEIKLAVKEANAEVVLFNHALSPSQERNLEKYLCCRVLDRIGLILDIFAQRARTHEGKLQVELAQLEHLSTRLVRGWTHLERQKGGIGLRGPGETQLESDRRMVRARMRTLHGKLEKVKQQRFQSRQARERAEVPVISLVGYTNAGKSTLFNALTTGSVYAADQLFATLDPTLKKMQVPVAGDVVVADTVGFIRHLPHKLVNAFHATLEEVAKADLLLHVIDVSDPRWEEHVKEVYAVLEEIGAQQVPEFWVLNKVDSLSQQVLEQRRVDCQGKEAVWVSAVSGQGLEELKAAIGLRLSSPLRVAMVDIPPQYSRLRAALYSVRAVVCEQVNDAGVSAVLVMLPEKKWLSLLRQERLTSVVTENMVIELDSGSPLMALKVLGMGQANTSAIYESDHDSVADRRSSDVALSTWSWSEQGLHLARLSLESCAQC